MASRFSCWSRGRLLGLLVLFFFILAPEPVRAQNDPCDQPGETPDLIVGDITGKSKYGPVGGITAFAVGTTACNIGSCWANWIAGTAEHPVIGQNMYRLKDGRFEQVGQSWLKHGFSAGQQTLCSTACVPGNSSHLGVNCSDPYTASQNGAQANLGPKREVNPYTGAFPYPPTDGTVTGNAIYKRLQVHNADLDPLLNPGALYFVEAQYVALDDAVAGNGKNNVSYARINVTGSGGVFDISIITGTNQREKSAIEAWKAAEPSVVLTGLSVPNDGDFVIAAKATDIDGVFWHYEYAVHNKISNRAARSFTVPIPFGAEVTNVGFHDVDYHSGEPFDGTDWSAVVGATSVTWTTATYAQNPNANALRWGTLYNFRFDANVPPGTHAVTVGLFRPGSPTEVSKTTLTPERCDADGVCDPGEDCSNCPADCAGQGGGAGCCGNGSCEAGENPCGCLEDCGISTPTEIACADGIDGDCDGPTDCADTDCCPHPACSGQDTDGDGYEQCDCDDGNGEVWARPDEAKDLVLSHHRLNGTTLAWAGPVYLGGVSVTYDALRSVNPGDFVTAASCLFLPDPSSPTCIDPTNPAPGGLHFYLVRAKNGCPSGEGPLGTDSTGRPREGRSCP